jgi:hypothetical protein
VRARRNIDEIQAASVASERPEGAILTSGRHPDREEASSCAITADAVVSTTGGIELPPKPTLSAYARRLDVVVWWALGRGPGGPDRSAVRVPGACSRPGAASALTLPERDAADACLVWG